MRWCQRKYPARSLLQFAAAVDRGVARNSLSILSHHSHKTLVTFFFYASCVGCNALFVFSSRLGSAHIAWPLSIVRHTKDKTRIRIKWHKTGFGVLLFLFRHCGTIVKPKESYMIRVDERWIQVELKMNEKKKQYRIGESCQPASQSTCGTEQQQQQLQIKNAERERYRWHRQTIARINNIVWCQFSLKYAGNVLINLTVYCHVISLMPEFLICPVILPPMCCTTCDTTKWFLFVMRSLVFVCLCMPLVASASQQDELICVQLVCQIIVNHSRPVGTRTIIFFWMWIGAGRYHCRPIPSHTSQIGWLGLSPRQPSKTKEIWNRDRN